MKKIFFVIFLSLSNIVLYSQDFNDIQGFGNLKLGITVDEMREVVDTSLLKDLSYYGTYETLDGRLSRYLLKRYEVSPNEYIEDLELKFIDNYLYQIDIYKYNSKIEFNLTQIYGQPEVEVKHDDNEFGASETKQWEMPLGLELMVLCQANTNKDEQSGSTLYSLSLKFIAASTMVEDLETIALRNFRKKYKTK